MGHHKPNTESREHREEHDQHRQETRDDVFAETGGDVDDLGSQDRRREEGDERH
jgi:hypothetical protein